MLHRPGAHPRARNSSAFHAGAPGARGSSGLARLGMLAIRQRIRAPLKLAWPPSRTRQQGTRDRSDATASRRVAVKSSTAGSPQISPITPERPGHLTPSSIAQSASRASRASTWMMSWLGRPGGWTRPDSRMAMRSCTHSSGLAALICASRKPAQPASRGCAANSSDKVGTDGEGRRKRSPHSLGMGRFSPVRLPPPATRDKPESTRLTTFPF